METPTRYPKLVTVCRECGTKLMSKHRWAITGPAGREGWAAHGGHGLCRNHYRVQWEKTPRKPGPHANDLDTSIRPCEDCGRGHATRGARKDPETAANSTRRATHDLCQRCYRRRRRGGTPVTHRQTKAEVLAEEAEFMGVEETARAYGIKPESVERAIYRARKRQQVLAA